MKTSNSIIIDTSVIFSLASSDDSNHNKAKDISSKLMKDERKILLPTDIFSETLNIIGKKLGRDKQLDTATDLLRGIFLLVEANDEIRKIALEKLKTLPASASYTDAIVMAFADEYKTKEIFGFDEVFSKLGYKLPF